MKLEDHRSRSFRYSVVRAKVQSYSLALGLESLGIDAPDRM